MAGRAQEAEATGTGGRPPVPVGSVGPRTIALLHLQKSITLFGFIKDKTVARQ
jgi:hypothetical protein